MHLVEEICKNCGHSKSLHPSCTLCECKTYILQEEAVEEIRQTKGPVSEQNMDDWCIDCGHHEKLHHLNPHERICKYWTDLCECKGFVSRSESLIAVRKSEGFISKAEVFQAMRRLEEEIREKT